jgi:hypothetical protein
MEAPIPFKMTVASQLCFLPSRPSHHHSSWSNSRTLAHLSVNRDPSQHLSPSEPRPSSLWQSRSRPIKPTAPLHTRYLCSHPILFLSSGRPLVLSSSHPLILLATTHPLSHLLSSQHPLNLLLSYIPTLKHNHCYCGGVQWHPLNYHLTRAVIVPVRRLGIALKLQSLRARHHQDD